MDRRSFIKFLTTASVAAPVAALTARVTRPEPKEGRSSWARDVERILDTRQIRCSYIDYAPYITKDPNTGNLSGIFYELTRKIGELADFDIQWQAETTIGTFTEDLELHKYDLFAGGLWPEAKQAKVVNYSLPVFYSGLGIYVRTDDHRFDNAPTHLNDPRFRIATIDAEMSHIVQRSDFPEASVLGLPSTTDISMLAESVVLRKADATIIEKAVANLYMKHNPGALRNLTDAKPIRIFENTWAFAHEASRLKAVLDTAIKEMLFSGYVDKVLAKYQEVSGSVYRVREPIE
jgi:polar amino acid transport system substrate-binding protein